MLDLIRHDAVHELRLARAPVNALDPALVRALRGAIEAAPGEGARVLMLSGTPGLFSAGLDLPALLQLDHDALHAFMVDFFGLCGALAGSTIPAVSAITGHSPAGGAVLAIMGDYRVMARSADPAKPFRIGLNEVQVGLPVPEPIQFALRRLVGTYRAERLLTAGAMVDSDRALALGFVDEVVETGRVVARALEWAHEWIELPEHAARETRRLARADLAAALCDPEKLPVATFVADWFLPEVQERLHAIVAQLKAKSRS